MKTFIVPFLFLCTAMGAIAQSLGEERDAAVRMQIHLDEKLFGPGFIDGKPGKFTKHAIAAYNRSVGRAEDDISALQAEADAAVPNPYVAAIVPSEAKNFVNTNLPYKREEQAETRALHYRSYFELMAERYHTSESVLYELNGKKTTWATRPGKTLIVPNVTPFKVEDVKRGQFFKGDDSNLSKRKVIIDTKERQIQVYEPLDQTLASNEQAISAGGEPLYLLVASFPTTPGQERYIHRGEWTLRNAVAWPTWRYDKQLLKEGKRSKEALQIPGGPNNPVGILWAGLSKSGIGIHGTDSPRTIGRARSSGCYRLANWDAIRIPQVMRPGATVIVK